MNIWCIIALTVLVGIIGYLTRWAQERYKCPVFCPSKSDEEYPEYAMRDNATLQMRGRIFNPNRFPVKLSSFSARTPGDGRIPVECKWCGQTTPVNPLVVRGRDMCECEFVTKPINDHQPEYLDIYYVDQTNKKRYAMRYFSPLTM
jgi:hypothetical protein